MSMSDEERRRLEAYLALARDFIEGRAAGPAFRTAFTERFKRDQSPANAAGELLSRMFNEAECYEPDPALLARLRERDPDLYIDEARLRENLRPLVGELAALVSRGG